MIIIIILVTVDVQAGLEGQSTATVCFSQLRKREDLKELKVNQPHNYKLVINHRIKISCEFMSMITLVSAEITLCFQVDK